MHSNLMEPKPKKERGELNKINLTWQNEKAKADLLEGLDLKLQHSSFKKKKKTTKTKQKTQDRLLEKHREN